MPGGSGGGSAPSGTTTTNVQPWSGQQPYLTSGFQAASDLYNGTPPQYYPNATYSPETANQAAGLNDVAYAANNDVLAVPTAGETQKIVNADYLNANPASTTFGTLAGTNYGTAANNAGSDTLAGLSTTNAGTYGTAPLADYLSGANMKAGNPNTTALVNSITAAVQPGIQSQFIGGGTLSSPEAARATAAGVTSALAPSLFGQYQNEEQNQINAGNAVANRYLSGAGLEGTAASSLAGNILSGAGLRGTAATGQSNAWEGGMNDVLRGIALSPGVESQQFYAPQQLLGAGTTEQNLGQNSINDAVQRWNYNQSLPYNALNQYMSSVGGTGYGSSTTTPFFGNGGSNILGSALGGASLGNMLFPAAAGATGFGAMGGAGLGALFGLLSDRRAKTDILPVGELDNGLTVYSYRYHGEPLDMRHIGLMADEVEREHPEAVKELPGFFGNLAGLKTVDYAKAVI